MYESNAAITSKEAIAARMFRNAARYWGYNDTDIDNFDPLVRLLIEACAVELYRVSNEIDSIQERMLEKLARMLTPEVYTAARPAHAVLHARATEAEAMVFPSMQFFHQKRMASKANGPLDTNVDLFFSPAGNFQVVDGDVRYMAMGQQLYEVREGQFKEVFLQTTAGRTLPNSSVWIALELNPRIENLRGLSFFFDLKNHPAKHNLVPLFHYSRWSINGIPLATQEGIWDAVRNVPVHHAGTGFDEFHLNQALERQVNNVYRQQFVTITTANEVKYRTERYPAAFASLFSSAELQQIQQDLLWVEIRMTPEFDESALDELVITINSFPVANRHLNEIRFRLQNNFNIVPLLTNEQFLSVESVQGLDNNGGAPVHYANNAMEAQKEKGTYMLRTGDVERFDSRNAVAYMDYLLELLRDESRAFAALGQDFVASLIKELNQNIALLEQKVRQNISLLNQMPTYLLLNPFVEGENIFVEFWSTNGITGNNIRSGTRLELYQGADLQRESISLVTTTTGGADKLKNSEMLEGYRHTLMTRNRVVTAEDVKSYCRILLQDKASNIAVKRGVAISPLPNEGLINTVDVEITPVPVYDNEEEWQDIVQELRSGLEQQSAVHAHYRIQILLPQ